MGMTRAKGDFPHDFSGMNIATYILDSWDAAESSVMEV